MELFERSAQLARLNDLFGTVKHGAGGACVVVHGEAGIGKTALVQAFAQQCGPGTVLAGGCEPLFMPRPLGPLLDLARQLPRTVAAALHQGLTFTGLFPALLAHLRAARTTPVLLIEDLHWADTGTLDLVRYVGRRMHEVRMLLLLTYRSDEVDAAHPLRRVLGDLPGGTTTRIGLKPLSHAGVQAMAAGARRSDCGLFETTQGNPFYVREMLSHQGQGVPASIADAVLLRVSRLPVAARELCELVSTCPTRADATLLYDVLGSTIDAADCCLQQGLLTAQDDALAFRQALVREVVHAALPAPRRADLHRAVFQALSRRAGADAARLVHHADRAGMTQAVEQLAARAAEQAAASGAHGEAARLYALALAPGACLDAQRRCGLLEAYAHECLLSNQHDAALAARSEALGMRRDMHDRLGEGDNLRWMARLHWLLGRDLAGARKLARVAIDVLEDAPPGKQLARAYSNLAHLYLESQGYAATRRWGCKAIELARRFDDAEALSHALNHVATAQLMLRADESQWATLDQSLEIAQRHGLHADAARASCNASLTRALHRHYPRALLHADLGVEHAESHGVEVLALRLRVRRAFVHLQMAHWEAAAAELVRIQALYRVSRLEAPQVAFVQALLNLRRNGGDAAHEDLERAAQMMDLAQAHLPLMSTAAARAEAAWLRGDEAGPLDMLDAQARSAQAGAMWWRAGEAAVWFQRLAPTASSFSPIASAAEAAWPAPYALELAGRHREAAAQWERLGSPYEQGLALCGGDEADLRAAASLFERLRCPAALDAVRRRLRAIGVRGVPRGRLARTRDDPLGLTAREREVFELLLQGRSNASIAQQLRRSERTVEHHVAAVLGKSGMSTRRQLIAGFANVPKCFRPS